MFAGRPKPTEKDSRCVVSQPSTWWVAGAVDPDRHLGTGPAAALMSWGGGRRACRSTVVWSAPVLLPAFPGRSSTASGSPVPSAPWSDNAHNGRCPNARVDVGRACSLSLWEVTRVAMSTT